MRVAIMDMRIIKCELWKVTLKFLGIIGKKPILVYKNKHKLKKKYTIRVDPFHLYDIKYSTKRKS